MDEKIYQPEGPDSGEGLQNYDIVRCRTSDGYDSFVILSERVLHTRTHWLGKTQPCTHPNCRWCDEGKLSEYHGYVLAGKPKDFTKVVLELTAPPVRKLMQELEEKHTLHGLGIRLSRKNGLSNGSVHLEIVKRDLGTLQFGSLPDLLPLLHTLWRFNPMRKAEAEAAQRRRSVSAGEGEIPQSGPIGTNGDSLPKHQRKARKRS